MEDNHAQSNKGESLSQWISKLSKKVLAGLWVLLSGMAVGAIQRLVPTELLITMRMRLLLQIVSVVGALLLFLSLLCLQGFLRCRIRLRYGLAWDSENNPVCYACHAPLAPHAAHIWKCPICGSQYFSRDDNGEKISVFEAIDKMKGLPHRDYPC